MANKKIKFKVEKKEDGEFTLSGLGNVFNALSSLINKVGNDDKKPIVIRKIKNGCWEVFVDDVVSFVVENKETMQTIYHVFKMRYEELDDESMIKRTLHSIKFTFSFEDEEEEITKESGSDEVKITKTKERDKKKEKHKK